MLIDKDLFLIKMSQAEYISLFYFIKWIFLYSSTHKFISSSLMMYHNLFNLSLLDGHLDYFQFFS